MFIFDSKLPIMKKALFVIVALFLATSISIAATNKGFDGIDLKQDKNGKIAVISANDVKQIRCFNETGRKVYFPVGENKKDILLENKLEKGVWYFQIKTESGESVIKKLEVN